MNKVSVLRYSLENEKLTWYEWANKRKHYFSYQSNALIIPCHSAIYFVINMSVNGKNTLLLTKAVAKSTFSFKSYFVSD